MINKLFLILTIFCLSSMGELFAEEAVIVLSADVSGGAAIGGEAIKRGLEIAINKTNLKGGFLGRRVKLVVKDHRGNPTRGIDHIESIKNIKNLVAVFAGVHTPVALEQLKIINQNKILFMIPWAAGTQLIDNNYIPNYVFRFSVRDEYAGEFLVNEAFKLKRKKLVLFLENTSWGRSNEAAILNALKKRSTVPKKTIWFNWGAKDFSEDLISLNKKEIDGIILVSNSPEAKIFIESMSRLSSDHHIPIISHWGLSSGNFAYSVSDILKSVDLAFLQTQFFSNSKGNSRLKNLAAKYLALYTDVSSSELIPAPAGVIHGYDLFKGLSIAVNQANSLDRVKIRDELEKIKEFNGTARDFAPLFTKKRHDALNRSDYLLAKFSKNLSIVTYE